MTAPAELDLLRLEQLVSGYHIGELIRYWPATAGIENSNYFLRTLCAGAERQYVLTVLEQPPSAGGALVPLLDTCVARGLPVPAVIRNRQGVPFSDLDGKPALVCPRLPGHHVCNPTVRQVAALGRFIARFHQASGAAQLDLPPYPRDLAWLEREADRCRGAVPYRAEALLADTRRRLASALARQDVGRLPRGPIHGDLFRDNVLFDERGLTGVLDFHHAAEGYLVYDLAVAANDWCTDIRGVLDPERTLALLRAYHEIRPLQRAELWFFPVFALYGALAFWTSRLVVDLRRRRGETLRAKNPVEFQRIVEHHHAHFFYVDERLLG
jgi:homoserine kinase type II